jgi:hypothetical protein
MPRRRSAITSGTPVIESRNPAPIFFWGGSDMALDSLVRKGVALANKLTTSLQLEVSHEAWIADDGEGQPQYALPVPYTAIVEEGGKARRSPTGEVVYPQFSLTFLTPIEPNGASGRQEPIDPRDRLTLPDGRTGPILGAPSGVADPETNAAYAKEVAIG